MVLADSIHLLVNGFDSGLFIGWQSPLLPQIDPGSHRSVALPLHFLKKMLRPVDFDLRRSVNYLIAMRRNREITHIIPLHVEFSGSHFGAQDGLEASAIFP